MRKTMLLKKMWLEKREFVTSEELAEYCKKMDMAYTPAIHYLLKMKYLTRVFRGMFRVRTLEEIKLGQPRYNHLEVVTRGLGLKGIKNWYFGLHTSLKINNMTHEYFTIDDVISDSIFRPKPIEIEGYKFKFTKFTSKLFNFGIKKKNNMNYSDPEKTILDFIYLSKQRGIDEGKIIMDVSGWSKSISKHRIQKYAMHYPNTIYKLTQELIN